MPSASRSGGSDGRWYWSSCTSWSAIRTGRIRAPGATPRNPIRATGRPAIIVAIAVPRPLQELSPPALPSTRSWPAATAPASCGCCRSVPPSTTATTTPRPVLNGQTRSGASINCGHGVSRTSPPPCS